MRQARLMLQTVAAFALLMLPACGGKSRPTLYPASGKVRFDGKPTPEAVVWLHPQSPTAPGEARPHGVVDAEGNFLLSTYTTGDGAAAGTYRVSISWYKRPARGDDIGPNLLPARYHDPATSGLPTVEIAASPNALPTFNLKN